MADESYRALDLAIEAVQIATELDALLARVRLVKERHPGIVFGDAMFTSRDTAHLTAANLAAGVAALARIDAYASHEDQRVWLLRVRR